MFGNTEAPIPRVALVGNAGSLLDSGLGPKIDGHNTVVRTNYCPTAGYEADVGTKTDAVVLNPLLQSGRTREEFEVPENWIEALEEDVILRPNNRFESEAKQKAEGRVYSFSEADQDFVQRIEELALDSRASTGLCAAVYLRPRTEHLSLFGFNLDQQTNTASETCFHSAGDTCFHSSSETCFHYYRDTEDWNSHSFEQENRVLKGLADDWWA
jgi:hypothetical protein